MRMNLRQLSWKPNSTIAASLDLAEQKRNGTDTENDVTTTDSRTLKEIQNDLSNPGAQQRVHTLIFARSENTRVNNWTANADKRIKTFGWHGLNFFLPFVNGYPKALHLDARLLDITTGQQVTYCAATCQCR
ncbi:hypothetical protein Daesc_001795, partial [Daldinia eschscholtzii]